MVTVVRDYREAVDTIEFCFCGDVMTTDRITRQILYHWCDFVLDFDVDHAGVPVAVLIPYSEFDGDGLSGVGAAEADPWRETCLQQAAGAVAFHTAHGHGVDPAAVIAAIVKCLGEHFDLSADAQADDGMLITHGHRWCVVLHFDNHDTLCAVVAGVGGAVHYFVDAQGQGGQASILIFQETSFEDDIHFDGFIAIVRDDSCGQIHFGLAFFRRHSDRHVTRAFDIRGHIVRNFQNLHGADARSS